MPLPNAVQQRKLASLLVSLACAAPFAAGAASMGAVDSSVAPRRSAAALDPVRVVPAVSSAASGRVEVELDLASGEMRYVLEYQSLEGSVASAHLHFGQSTVNGGVFAWLCGNVAEPGPVGTPACPAAPGRLEGVLSAAQVVGPTAQGVAPGRLEALAGALAEGLVYVDVHSSRFGGGELRGQLPAARSAQSGD